MNKREKEEYSVVGYKLDNTLSEYGAVNRGVCEVDEDGYLKHITECKQIVREANGMISYPGEDGTVNLLSGDDPVSMNMWGFYPSYFRYFEREFTQFMKTNISNVKAEYYIPTLIDQLIISGERKTKVLHCDAEWFGVTYREDKQFVSERLERLIGDEVYPEKLWE